MSDVAKYSAYLCAQHNVENDKYDDAITYFNKISTTGKSFIVGETLIGLATCYDAKGEYKKALEYFEKALNKNSVLLPGHPNIVA
mgnify:CR=1 FL=1